MSRIRSIHPGFFTDEDIVSVSMAARMLMIGIGVEADDKGVFEWKPITIKMRLFPADNIDVAALLEELAHVGLIRRYEVAGKAYGAIKNFRKFQRPKTPNNIHPAPRDILIYVAIEKPDSETPPADPDPVPPNVEEIPDNEPSFPPKGEKPPQMEEGGGRMKEESPPPPKGKVDAFPRPDFADAQVWADFLKNRKTKRLSNTATAYGLFVSDMERVIRTTGWPPGEILRLCTAKGWGAIHVTDEMKGDGNGTNNRKSGSGGGQPRSNDGFLNACRDAAMGGNDASDLFGRPDDGTAGDRSGSFLRLAAGGP